MFAIKDLNSATPAEIAYDLGERLRRSDESTLADLLRLYGPAVAGGLQHRYVVLNSHDVEDVLAIALHRLWKFRTQFDPAKASLKSLFCRIADNVAKNLFKLGWQKVRQHEVEIAVATHVAAAALAPEISASDITESNEVMEDVQQVLAKLPAAYRHIILADAYSWDRVAESDLLSKELEIPAGTVRVYRSRAIAAIRSEMRKRGYEVP